MPGAGARQVRDCWLIDMIALPSLKYILPSFMLAALGTALWADQVTLANGDIITGAVVKKDGAKLTLKSEFLGEVTIPWTAVKSLKSDQELFVVLPGGHLVSGKVSTSGNALEVAAPTGASSVPLADVTDIRNPAEQHNWERLEHPGLLELWTGHFDIGLALARGNARTDTLTTAFDANRVSRHDKITVHFDEIYSTARINGLASTTASAEHANWTYQRDLGPRFFVSTLNAYDHDAFQDLDLRFVAGGGVGVNAIKTPRTSLGLLAGGDYEREAFICQRDAHFGRVQCRRRFPVQDFERQFDNAGFPHFSQLDQHGPVSLQLRFERRHGLEEDGWPGTSPSAISS